MSQNNVIAAGREASHAVAALPLKSRLRCLQSLNDALLVQRDALVEHLHRETHKSQTDALMSEWFPLVDWIGCLIRESGKWMRPQSVPTPLTLMGKKSWIEYEPYGVILAITPWNYPLYQTLLPITNALVTGNAIVVKPSEVTPLKGLIEELLEPILRQASLPRTAVQIVYGDGSVGAELIAARPDKVFFTGSVATGKKILSQCAPHLIPAELELGGKDPMIVFEDVHLERAVAGALWGSLTNAGQSCTSVERVLVQASIKDAFVTRLQEKLGTCEVPRMTSEAQAGIVRRQLEELGQGGDGIAPVVIVDPPISSRIWAEETFGPVIAVRSFQTEKEAIELADSEYGLSASVWSRDLNRARRVARALRVGNVSINNVMVTEANPYLPFGGYRQSGMGRIKGEAGFKAFLQSKSILQDQDSSKIEAHWFPYTAEKNHLFKRMAEGWVRRGWSWWKFLWNGLRLESLAQKKT